MALVQPGMYESPLSLLVLLGPMLLIHRSSGSSAYCKLDAAHGCLISHVLVRYLNILLGAGVQMERMLQSGSDQRIGPTRNRLSIGTYPACEAMS
jgi:hypothetical protein